jgi:hypothetical protein
MQEDPQAPSTATDSNGDSYGSDHRPAAASRGSALRSHDPCPAWNMHDLKADGRSTPSSNGVVLVHLDDEQEQG